MRQFAFSGHPSRESRSVFILLSYTSDVPVFARRTNVLCCWLTGGAGSTADVCQAARCWRRWRWRGSPWQSAASVPASTRSTSHPRLRAVSDRLQRDGFRHNLSAQSKRRQRRSLHHPGIPQWSVCLYLSHASRYNTQNTRWRRHLSVIGAANFVGAIASHQKRQRAGIREVW